MKKKLSIALLLLVVVIAAITFVGCKHKHEYTSSVTAPTCTERGYTTYVCECGDSYKDNYVEAKPHNPNTPTNENVVGASCTQKGSYDEVIKCKDCNAVISTTHHEVEMTSHTPKDEPARENEIPATCSTLGSYDEVVRCKDCNAVISSTPKTIEMLDHTPKSATHEDVVNATCTTQGSYNEVIRCKDCDTVISTTPKTIDKLPHTPKTAQMENVVNATCANAGSYDEVVRCDVCDEVLSSVHHDGVTLPHTPEDVPARENEIPATCTTAGSYDEVIRCKDCNAVISSTPKTIEMLAHTPNSAMQEDIVNSTCSTLGSYNEVVRCKDCNAIITSTPKTIDKLPHTPANAVTENNVPSTCTSQGSYDSVVYCTVCNEQLSVTHNTVAKLPHNYDYGTCKDCGYKIENEAQFTADGFNIDYTTQPAIVSCTVSNATSNIDLVRAFNLQNGSTWKLYSDFEGNYEYKLKAMSLDCGHNTAYIIVYYDKDSDYFTRYKLDIYRLSIRNYTFADFDGNILSVGTVEELSTVSLPETDPTRDYYDFDCWTLDGKQVTFPYTVTDDITFAAKYLPTTYSITYVVNGGTFTTEVNDYDIERAVTFDTPTKQYYDFAGWYDNAELIGNVVTGISQGNHDNKTFYAKYTPTIYGITYELNGGTLITNVNDYDIERAVTFDTPTKQYYDFVGWYDNAELNGSALTGIPVGNHDNKTFYAKYTPTIYGITYELNGGTLTTEVNDYDIERAVTFDNPTRDYYTFAGWYSNSAFSGSIINGITVGNYGTKTFYAKWTPITYGITYELNGGTITTEVNDYDIERAVTFDTPTKQYYDFAGWYDNAELNGNAYNGLTVGNHDNKTFYAKWTLTNYLVNYQLDGGVISTHETFTIEDLPYTPTPATPYKDNCFFDGWYKDASLTESDITITNVDDVTIYAKWINATNLFTYALSSDRTYYTVTGYTGSYTDIAIPKTYNSKPVTSIGSDAFWGCSSLTSVTIGNSVASIGDYAFRDCSSLKTVYWNATACTSAGSYYAPIFDGCSSLTTVIIGDNVTTIPSYAFHKCSSLTSVTIGNSVTKIGSCAFQDCSSLTSITIPDSVTSIGSDAFWGCSSLTSVTIGNSVASIDDYAFRYCSSLTSVTIPNSVTTIGRGAFRYCSSLTSVYYTGDIAGWCNISYDSDDASPLCYAHNLYIDKELVTELVIPDTVTEIKDYAFYNCTGITSVTIPDSVTSIGAYAFCDCSSLTSVYYTGDIASWCNISFGYYYANPLYYVHNLYINNELVTELVIPDTVTEIKTYAFYYCTSITSVIIPDSVTSIGAYAFGSCNRLTSVTIPDNVTTIRYAAFINCRIETVYYTGTADDWANISIGDYNTDLTNATRYYECKEKTYSFVTNCDATVDDITTIVMDKLPVIANGDLYFAGWYKTPIFDGSPITNGYYSDINETFYARWLTEDEYCDGSSFERAKMAASGQTYNVDITTGGQLYYFAFTATEDGTLTVYSNGSNDTYGYLYSSTQSQLKTDDDSGDSRNFKITYTVTAGQTYYVAVKLYSSSTTGSFTVTFE